ncbi:MAG: YfiR family protein [Bacteroidetes bacterium]|nr:YfiR family protein [Bacteroidota bacterium]
MFFIFISNAFYSGRKTALVLSLTILLMSMKPVGDAGNEYTIKAMFIYNFTKHIEWNQPPSPSFRIGIVGNSDIQGALELIATQKKVGNLPIEVIKITSDDNSLFQVIFVSKSQVQKLEELAKKYAGKSVLIISEEAKHSEQGATINLITTDNKVRFELNQTAGKVAGLKISSTLANLAMTVNP